VSEALRPSEGARYLLERTSRDDIGAAASYRGVIYTPLAEHHYRLELADSGSAELSLDVEAAGASPDRAEDELETGLLNLARSTARAAARRRMEGLKPWPDRVLRWRGPGRG
jgi:hypothetical protein